MPVLAIILLIATGSAAAASRVSVTTRDNLATTSDTDTKVGAAGESVFVNAVTHTLPRSGTGLSTAEARATEGAIGISTFAAAETSPDGSGASVDAQATASWSDRITFIAPSVPIDIYWIEGRLLLSGAMVSAVTGPQAHSNSFAVSEVDLRGTGISGDTGRSTRYSGHPEDNVENPLNEVYLFRTVAIPGTETFLTFSLSAYTTVFARVDDDEFFSTATSAADFRHTLRWGGIDRIVDSNGKEIKDYTITSQSGFDYTAPSPIPEPAVLWMLLAGLGVGWVRVHRAHAVDGAGAAWVR